MNVVIVGAGALGSIIAAYLARSGHEVSLIARGDRAQQLSKHGVIVTGREDFIAHCQIVTEPASLRQTDLVIVAVKRTTRRLLLCRWPISTRKVHFRYRTVS